MSTLRYLRAGHAYLGRLEHQARFENQPSYGTKETQWKPLRAVQAIEAYEEVFSSGPPTEAQKMELPQALEQKAQAAERESPATAGSHETEPAGSRKE